MSYQVIIGLEVHAELKTKSKMFCSCPNISKAQKPNTNVCPICLGHPGTLPQPNKEAINYILKMGLAINANFNLQTKFDRKSYFYPDLSKGYQITQADKPLVYAGSLLVDGENIPITRIHLEEDTGKSFHPHDQNYTLIDFNRAGKPLLELVTAPLIKNAEQAKKFCQKFQQLLRYLDISNADMEKGEMRCEANISLQSANSFIYEDGEIKAINNKTLNNKVEVKNINSFRALERAINYEIERQGTLLNKKEFIPSETRGWDEKQQVTVAQRSKEQAADYRYFPEPDIPAFEIDGEHLANLKNSLPELPAKKLARFKQEYGLSEDLVEIIIADKNLANWTEQVISELNAWIEAFGDQAVRQEKKLAKIAANWITNDLLRYFKERNETIANIKITAENFAELISLIYQKKINSSTAQTLFEFMYNHGGDPTDIMDEMGLKQIDDQAELDKIVKEVITKNPQAVIDYKQGKENAIQFLLGQTMTVTKGRANPELVKKLLLNRLS